MTVKYTRKESDAIRSAYGQIFYSCQHNWTDGPRIRRAFNSLRRDFDTAANARAHVLRAFVAGARANLNRKIPALFDAEADGFYLAFACGYSQARFDRVSTEFLDLIDSAIATHDVALQRSHESV